MAKFYVSSAAVNIVVQAEDAEGAALWALHQWMEKMSANSNSVSEEEVALVFTSFEDCVQVSEQGFGRSDAGCFRTDSLTLQYVELITALETITRQWLDN